MKVAVVFMLTLYIIGFSLAVVTWKSPPCKKTGTLMATDPVSRTEVARLCLQCCTDECVQYIPSLGAKR